MFVVLLVLLVPMHSDAFLDFLGKEAKNTVELTAYIDAASELSQEISPDENIEKGAQDIKRRIEALKAESDSLIYLNESSKALLKGPDWSMGRLETNIRNTTDYIRRLKSLLVRARALGNEGAIALNTTETNVALNEVQKNQQTMIMQNNEAKIRELEREREELLHWNKFVERQRSLRRMGGS